MPPPFFFLQDVHLPLKLRQRLDRARRRQHLPPLHIRPLNPAQQAPNVVPGLPTVQQLAKHLHARHHRRARLPNPHDLHRVAHFDLPALHAPRHHRPAPLDPKHILDRHQERFVHCAHRRRHVTVHHPHQLQNRRILRRIRILRRTGQRLERRPAHDRNLVAGELVTRQQVAQFQFDQVQQFGVVHHVHLVQEDDDGGHLDLAREQDVLAGLRHRAIGRGDDENRAVHLRRAGDHVLDIVGVAGAINVGIVAFFGFVFDVRDGDGQDFGIVAATLFLGGFGDFIVGDIVGHALQRHDFGDGGGEGSLAVVHVPDRPDVDVRFSAFEFLLCHLNDSS